MSSEKLSITKTENPKVKPNQDELGFGKYFTDHMFIMDYNPENGWHDPRIVPYQPLQLDPSCMTFHYGQTVFEGMKAYKTKDGRALLFRPEQNLERMNLSNDRLSIPNFPADEALDYLKELVKIDKDWIPTAPGTSLYVRPFIISTEPSLLVAPSANYMFIIILSPVGAYYEEGLKPVGINIEYEYTRAVKGGTGAAKTGGNYAAAHKAQENATKEGQAQVLWLDGIEKKYIEEVGSMNVFFKINGQVVTPMLNGSILNGVTRRSIIELLASWNIEVVERKISIDELYHAYQNNQLEEAFGTGTAAVISPIGNLSWQGEKLLINDGVIGDLSQKLYDTLTGIQTGELEDTFQWTVEVE